MLDASVAQCLGGGGEGEHNAIYSVSAVVATAKGVYVCVCAYGCAYGVDNMDDISIWWMS